MLQSKVQNAVEGLQDLELFLKFSIKIWLHQMQNITKTTLANTATNEKKLCEKCDFAEAF